MQLPSNDGQMEQQAIVEIRKLPGNSGNPIFILDGGTTRNQVLAEVNKLLVSTSYPYFTTPWGK